jgi:succinylglutamic semialdehyde dehydrogenase
MSGELISFEPATGVELWRGTVDDHDEAVAAVRAGWAGWAARPLAVRIETLRRFSNVLRSRQPAFAELLARETGRPRWDALEELDAVIGRVDAAIAAIGERAGQRRLEGALGARTAVRHKPHGVLVVITPASQPVETAVAHLVPALLAGNGVVFKPSEHCPATGRTIAECLLEAGVPADALRVVVGGPAEGCALALHPDVDGVMFTGTSANGIWLHRKFAEQPHKLLVLALGGNNPLIAWKTPDPAAAATVIVQSAFASAGQRCLATRRLIVEEGAGDALLEQVVRLAGRLIVGTPFETPAPFMGCLIDNAAADRLQDAFLARIMSGGRVLAHLTRRDNEKPFLSPAIIDVTGIPTRTDEELFGPVLQIVRVPDFASAVAEANATRFGLTATLVGGSPELYGRFWAVSRAGAVNWNRPLSRLPAAAPFGGLGLSGNGRPGGSYAADSCAYPVLSAEAEQPRATIGVGLADHLQA